MFFFRDFHQRFFGNCSRDFFVIDCTLVDIFGSLLAFQSNLINQKQIYVFLTRRFRPYCFWLTKLHWNAKKLPKDISPDQFEHYSKGSFKIISTILFCQSSWNSFGNVSRFGKKILQRFHRIINKFLRKFTHRFFKTISTDFFGHERFFQNSKDALKIPLKILSGFFFSKKMSTSSFGKFPTKYLGNSFKYYIGNFIGAYFAIYFSDFLRIHP